MPARRFTLSLFSFIAFPREVDKSCLKSRVDESKKVRVEDLNETELERNNIGIPDNVEVYLGDLDDFDELDVYEKEPWFSFDEVFENQFVYSMNALFRFARLERIEMSIEEELEHIEKYLGIHMAKGELLKEKAEAGEVRERSREKTTKYIGRCREQLNDLVKHNIGSGEIVEIYSGWASDYRSSYKLGPPKETRVLNVEEVLVSELLDLADELKIEITRM